MELAEVVDGQRGACWPAAVWRQLDTSWATYGHKILWHGRDMEQWKLRSAPANMGGGDGDGSGDVATILCISKSDKKESIKIILSYKWWV